MEKADVAYVILYEQIQFNNMTKYNMIFGILENHVQNWQIGTFLLTITLMIFNETSYENECCFSVTIGYRQRILNIFLTDLK